MYFLLTPLERGVEGSRRCFPYHAAYRHFNETAGVAMSTCTRRRPSSGIFLVQTIYEMGSTISEILFRLRRFSPGPHTGEGACAPRSLVVCLIFSAPPYYLGFLLFSCKFSSLFLRL